MYLIEVYELFARASEVQAIAQVIKLSPPIHELFEDVARVQDHARSSC